MLSAIIVKIIGALFKIPLSADYALGDLGFGYFSSVYDMYIPIYTLALSGFPVAIARMIADLIAKGEKERVKDVFAVSHRAMYLSGLIIAVIIALISLPIILFGNSEENIGYSLLTVSPSILCCALASCYRGYFEGFKNMTATAVSNIIEALGKLILGLSFGIIAMRLTGNPALSAAATMLGITIGTLFSCIYLKVCFNKVSILNSIAFSGDRVKKAQILKELTMLIIPIAVASLSVGFTAFIDTITLKPQLAAILSENKANSEILLKGTLYNDLNVSKIPTLLYGIKSKTHTLFNLVPTLTMALGMGAIPLVTENFVRKQRNALKENVETVLKISSIIVMPISAGFISMGQGIMELLYSDKSAVLSGRLLSIYGVAALFAGLAVPTTSLLQAGNRQKSALFNIGYGMLAKVICNVVLTGITEINVFGAAIGTAVCFGMIFILNMICLYRTFNLKLNICGCFIKPLLASVMCGITAFICENKINFRFSEIVSILTGGAVYFIALILLKTVSVKELKDIVK